MNKEDEIYIYYLIGQNLRRIRKSTGMTQEQLADASTYSVGYIMNLESKSYTQTCSLGTLWRFATVLKCDIRDFFEPLAEEVIEESNEDESNEEHLEENDNSLEDSHNS